MTEARRRTPDTPLGKPPAQPILGWNRAQPEQRPIGFHAAAAAPSNRTTAHEPVPDPGEGHMMTIAPTGAGKGRSVIIPTLLSYPGPVIVIDPKGENAQVTARRRREMGQDVYILDPFEVVGPDSASFNLLDTIDPNAPDAYEQAMSMAELMSPGRSVTDPFWENSARGLITTLILHVAAARPPVLRNLSEVAYLLNQSMEDIGFTIKEMKRSKCDIVRQLAGGLEATEQKVWASILATARTGTRTFNGSCFATTSFRTDFPLDGIVRGDPISLYLVLPPDKLDSHGALLRLWIGSLMDQLAQRRHRVEQPTLFILDEAAQLGSLEQLRRAITLMRGYGVRTWSFWQDLSQLQRLYPDWETLYNNTRFIQTFGATTHRLAESLAHLLRLPADIDPLRLPPDQLILAEAGRNPRVLDKPDYLEDVPFRGLYDANDFYRSIQEQAETAEDKVPTANSTNGPTQDKSTSEKPRSGPSHFEPQSFRL